MKPLPPHRLLGTALLFTAPCATLWAQEYRPAESYVPRLEVRDDEAFPGGRSIHHDILIVREVSPGKDEKVILVKSVVNQAPSDVGPVWGDPSITEREYGPWLFLPNTYAVQTTLGIDGLPPAAVRMVRQAPRSDGTTDRTIQDKFSVKASLGIGGGAEVTSSVAKDGGVSLGKLPVSFSAGVESVAERSVTMTLKDYFTESGVTQDEVGDKTAFWHFRVAPDIDNNIWYSYSHYRVGPGWLFGHAGITPMMRRAALETVSEWRVPGKYEGPVYISTVSGVALNEYGYGGKDTLPDPEADMQHVTRIDLGSPQLARQPMVRLQSLSGVGHCLSQPNPAQPDVTLEPCAAGNANPGQQWYLDTDQTYRNRASRQCLAADPMGGGVRAEACGGSMLNKQWQWRADRLHSIYMDGGSWGLHVRDGKPMAIFDPVRHQDIGSNPFHHLLRPWSSYPRAPTQGDVVPALAGSSPAISQGLLRFTAVSADERWQPRPVDAIR